MRAPSATGLLSRTIIGLMALLLLVTPSLDLARDEAPRDSSQGVRCPLHANPAVAAVPVWHGLTLVWARVIADTRLDRVSSVPPSVFVPPRV
jgi:hypothetical protein